MAGPERLKLRHGRPRSGYEGPNTSSCSASVWTPALLVGLRCFASAWTPLLISQVHCEETQVPASFRLCASTLPRSCLSHVSFQRHLIATRVPPARHTAFQLILPSSLLYNMAKPVPEKCDENMLSHLYFLLVQTPCASRFAQQEWKESGVRISKCHDTKH